MKLTIALWAALLEGNGRPAWSQVVTPVSVNGTTTTVTPGSIITVSSAAIPGLRATNPGGQITANGITVNLGPGTTPRTYIGAQAEAGGVISLDGSSINTVQAATGQRGIVSTGSGSQITGTGTVLSIGLATTTSDTIAVSALNGGSVSLTGATVNTLGGGNGVANHAVFATGAGTQVTLSGGSFSTLARGSFGATAQDGAVITLTGGTQITTTGVQNNTVTPNVGSHALFATGSGSTINGTDAILSTSGLLASGARAELGATIF